MGHQTGGYASGFAFVLVVFILLVIIGAAAMGSGGYPY